MKSQLRGVNDHGNHYTALMFCCPGCAELLNSDGLHMLAVNSPQKQPSWNWDNNLEKPTLSPSILTRSNGVCHSFLKAGIFEFLGDSTHSMAGQNIPMPDIPTWAEKEAQETINSDGS